MVADFYIPGFSNDIKNAVQKNHLGGQILYPSKNEVYKCFLKHLFFLSEIEDKDKLVHDYYHKLMSQSRQGKGGIHPVVLKVDTLPTTGKVDIKVYTPLTVTIGKRNVEGTMPLWLQTEILYSDADRTILDELRKCAQHPQRKLVIPSGIEPLKTAVEDLVSQLRIVQDYVNVSIYLYPF